MLGRYWRTVLAESPATWSRSRCLRHARRLLPDLERGDLLPGGSGVRAQAVARDGTLADDFVIAGEGPLLHVLNAPSPAATASLAIGDHLAEMAVGRLGGG
jgi:L-2-hydroxyglutarate oxidase